LAREREDARALYQIDLATSKRLGKAEGLYIRDGLDDLVQQVRALEIQSIAVPSLGCGHGGLDWEDVRPLIEAAFVSLPDVRVVLYAPNGAPA
jgi:O-acetyl-ADP-ribose deacetylase (regulator of RNase III)